MRLGNLITHRCESLCLPGGAGRQPHACQGALHCCTGAEHTSGTLALLCFTQLLPYAGVKPRLRTPGVTNTPCNPSHTSLTGASTCRSLATSGGVKTHMVVCLPLPSCISAGGRTKCMLPPLNVFPCYHSQSPQPAMPRGRQANMQCLPAAPYRAASSPQIYPAHAMCMQQHADLRDLVFARCQPTQSQTTKTQTVRRHLHQYHTAAAVAGNLVSPAAPIASHNTTPPPLRSPSWHLHLSIHPGLWLPPVTAQVSIHSSSSSCLVSWP